MLPVMPMRSAMRRLKYLITRYTDWSTATL